MTPTRTFFTLCFLTLVIVSGDILGTDTRLEAGEGNNPNSYTGTDSERIAQALAAADEHGGVVRITARVPDAVAKRNYWLIDSAILLKANTTLILENCVIKLSDECRDNFIRSANCGLGIDPIQPIENVHILGIGRAELVGADHPRATGDGAKVLGQRTCGTDAGKEGVHQKGDWRNIGVLFAYVNHFSIRNITIREAHCWSMSMERCACGKIADISFDSSENRLIDGKQVKTLNQDGLDLRKGCHDIIIDSITGGTGDDVVALTAIGPVIRKDGLEDSTEVSGTRALGPENDIHHVIIRNVAGYARGGHQIVRLLNASGIRIHNVIIDGVIDTSPLEGIRDNVTIKIGDANPAWGGVTPIGDTFGISINNIQSRSRTAVMIAGSLTDSVISNVINLNPGTEPVVYQSGREYVKNVTVTGMVSSQLSTSEQPR